MINLHATPAYPNEVSSPKSLSFLVGNPPRQMQIFSGIAIPSWDSQGSLDFEEVLVHFNVPAPSQNPNDWEYTATISLASIDADGDNDFTFATDECAVLADENTGELLLYAKIAVLGEPAHLNRFSYHVEVLSKIHVQGIVFGTIRWHEFYGNPTKAITNGAPMFRVGPATATPGKWVWDDQFTVEISTAPQHIGNYWVVPYSLPGLPFNQSLTIRPDLHLGTLTDVPPTVDPNSPEFAPPFRTITLTTSQPSVTDVDFEMILTTRPR